MLFRRIVFPSLALVSASLLIPPAISATKPPAEGNEPPPNAASGVKIEPQARTLMNRMGEAYTSLSALSTTVKIQLPNSAEDLIQTTFRYQKPQRFWITRTYKSQSTTLVTDGDSLWVTSTRLPNRYLKTEAQPSLYGVLRQIDEYMGREGAQTILSLMSGSPPVPDSGKLQTLKMGEPGQVDGVAVETVVMTWGNYGKEEIRETYSIGKSDHLLRKLVVENIHRPGRMEETYAELNANPAFKPADWAFVPPADAKALAPDTNAHPDLKRGGKPFPIESKDLNGDPISLDQFRGKVVLLNFWGTWCPACLAEIPALTSVYHKYKDKGFEVVGIALEEEIQKPRVEAFLKSKGLPWRQFFEGKRNDNTIAERYGVTATPHSILIGADGNIVAMGLRGEKELEAAVRLALDGKKG